MIMEFVINFLIKLPFPLAQRQESQSVHWWYDNRL